MMDASPLGRLPAELRNRIYELVLIFPTFIEIEPSSQHAERPKAPELLGSNPNTFALVKTCKQVHSESSAIIYADNTFDFSDWEQPSQSLRCFNDFIHEIGLTNTAALRAIEFGVNARKINCNREDQPETIAENIKRMPTEMPACTFHLSFGCVYNDLGRPILLCLIFKDEKTLEESRDRSVLRIEEWRQRMHKSANPYVPKLTDWAVESYTCFLEMACAKEEPE